MTRSVMIYFPVHCGHTGSPDWGGGVPQARLWVESRPRRASIQMSASVSVAGTVVHFAEAVKLLGMSRVSCK